MLPLIQEALEGRYKVERQIARGGASRVFFARDPNGEPKAVKVLHPELAVTVTADRFQREVHMLRELDHPQIARVLDSGEAEYFIYYVMDFIDGPNIRQHLDRVRRASVSDTRRIASDMLAALGYAHTNSIVHRDVKPENIVLSANGAMLLDFGIAKAIAAAGSTRLTRSGFTVGTSAYMSPEQVAGAEDIDYRTDVYSMGCVLFECLAGRPPFVHQREETVLRLQQLEEAPDVREFRKDTPTALAEGIGKALRKEREERWNSAAEMKAALEDGS